LPPLQLHKFFIPFPEKTKQIRPGAQAPPRANAPLEKPGAGNELSWKVKIYTPESCYSPHSVCPLLVNNHRFVKVDFAGFERETPNRRKRKNRSRTNGI
jgi:hypothetical protein